MKITAPPTQYPTIYDRNPIPIVTSIDTVFAPQDMSTLFTYTVPANRYVKISLVQLRINRVAPIGNYDFVHLLVSGIISGTYTLIATAYLTSFNPLYETSTIATPDLLIQSGDSFSIQLGSGLNQEDFRISYSLIATEFDA